MLKPWITREVRWFSPGRIPVPVQNWYDLREKQIEPVRTDIYLSGLGTSAGVKLREGRLEIKHRTEDHGLNEFAPGLSGHVENWIKWGFDMSSDDWPGVKSTHWVPIQKKRQIQLYTFTESGAVIQSVPCVLPSQGGGVELCAITTSSVGVRTVVIDPPRRDRRR